MVHIRIIDLIKNISSFNQNSRFYFTIGEDKEKKYYIEKINEIDKNSINFILKKFD